MTAKKYKYLIFKELCLQQEFKSLFSDNFY